MNKSTWVAVVAILVMALPAAAGIQYEFFQKTTTDTANEPPADLTGRAIIDGGRARVDFISGTMYPPGTYVISTDGARTLRFVDPLHKSYTEVNVAAVASAIGTANLKIANLQSQVVKLEDRPIIAGVPAEHYRLTVTYEITWTMRNIPLTQSVRTVIDRWTTVAFGDIDTAIVSGAIQTGNPETDRLIDIETTKIKGFPLKEIVTITSTNPKHRPVPGSGLNVPATRTRTRETTVTSVRTLNADPQHFAVPVAYRKAEAQDTKKPQVHQLNFEPSTK